jgi:hypothetical protein
MTPQGLFALRCAAAEWLQEHPRNPNATAVHAALLATNPLPIEAVCKTCNGKMFVNSDGSANNAFEGSDRDPVIPCPTCGDARVA